MIERRYPDMTPELYESMYEEEWRVTEDFPRYSVSNYGQIRNDKTGRIMKQKTTPKGYRTMKLRKDINEPCCIRVNRIVAKAFCKNDHEQDIGELDVNHCDGDKANNYAYNLEWATRQENIRHAFDTGLNVSGRGRRVRVLETGEEYCSTRECAKHIGKESDHTSISRYLKGELGHVKGYHFEWVD